MSRRLSCIPFDDADFRDAATAALHGIDGQAGPDEIESVLTDLLRISYPTVQVHRQHELARVGDADDLWYVYRDGKPITAPRAPRPTQTDVCS
jgi:hypothetical protein